MSPPRRPPSRRALAAAALCAALAATAAHAPYLGFGFYVDDYLLLREVHDNLTAGRAPWLASSRCWDLESLPTITVFRPLLEGVNAVLLLASGRDAA